VQGLKAEEFSLSAAMKSAGRQLERVRAEMLSGRSRLWQANIFSFGELPVCVCGSGAANGEMMMEKVASWPARAKLRAAN